MKHLPVANIDTDVPGTIQFSPRATLPARVDKDQIARLQLIQIREQPARSPRIVILVMTPLRKVASSIFLIHEKGKS